MSDGKPVYICRDAVADTWFLKAQGVHEALRTLTDQDVNDLRPRGVATEALIPSPNSSHESPENRFYGPGQYWLLNHTRDTHHADDNASTEDRCAG